MSTGLSPKHATGSQDHFACSRVRRAVFSQEVKLFGFLLHLLLSLGNPCFKFKSLSGSNFQTGSALCFFLLALLDVKLEHAWNSETVLSALCLLNFLTSFFMPLKLFPYSFTRLAIFKVVFWKTFEPPL